MRYKCLIEQRRWSNQKLRGSCGPSRNGKIAVGLDRIEAAFAFGPSRGVLKRRQRLIMQRGSKTDCVFVINNCNSSRWRKLEAFCEGWLHELAWERWIVGVWASCGVNGQFHSCELCVYFTVINAVIVQLNYPRKPIFILALWIYRQRMKTRPSFAKVSLCCIQIVLLYMIRRNCLGLFLQSWFWRRLEIRLMLVNILSLSEIVSRKSILAIVMMRRQRAYTVTLFYQFLLLFLALFLFLRRDRVRCYSGYWGGL